MVRKQEDIKDVAIARKMVLRSGAVPGSLGEGTTAETFAAPPPDFKRVVEKRKKDFGAALGIKKAPSNQHSVHFCSIVSKSVAILSILLRLTSSCYLTVNT